MRETRWFGREMPEHAVPKEGSPGERHEAARERMYATVIRHAEAAQAFLEWIDKVTVGMTREQVSSALARQTERAYADIPKEFIDDVRVYINTSERYHQRDAEVIARARQGGGNEEDIDSARDTDPETQHLVEKIQASYEHVESNESFQLVYETEEWTQAMMRSWDEVRLLRREPVRALAALNAVLAKRGVKPFAQDEIIDTVFEPFCVQFVVTQPAFDRLEGVEMAVGIYFSGTTFTAIRQGGSLWGRPRRETMRHESAHNVIDRAHSHGMDFRYSSLFAFARNRRRREAVWKESGLSDPRANNLRAEILSSLRASALDELHNEFLAELNVTRMKPDQNLREWYWTTAEGAAQNFPETVRKLSEEVEDFDPTFARQILEANADILKRFTRAKSEIVRSLAVASRLGGGARSFVASAAFVMPVRSYHHMGEILRRKYGDQRVAEARIAAELDNALSDRTFYDFKHLDAFMRSPAVARAANVRVDWSERFSNVRDFVVENWKMHSLSALKKVIARTRSWPAPFLADPKNNPVHEIAVSFFWPVVDHLWRDGAPHVPCDPRMIAKDPTLRAGLVDSLETSFGGNFYAEDLESFLNLDRAPNRSEVLSSPMSAFCSAAGVGAEFRALVEKYVPETTD